MDDQPQTRDSQPDRDSALGRLDKLLGGAPLHREIYVRLLGFCKERRLLADAEDAVRSWPQSTQIAQSPYRLIRDLVEEGGLDWIALDSDGAELAPDRIKGLSVDEVEDLTAAYAVETTAAGADAAEEWSPAWRLGRLMESSPERIEAFAEVLALCKLPQSLTSVEELLERLGFLDTLRAVNGQPLKVSYFVDVLERAGGLEWDGAWRITEAGSTLLQSLTA